MRAGGQAPSASGGWGLGLLWAAVGLEPEPEPETEEQRALDDDVGATSGAGCSAAAVAGALPGVGDSAEQAEQLLVRLVGDWEVSGSDSGASGGFLSLDQQDDDEAPSKKRLVGELQLGAASFEVYGVASVQASSGSAVLRVACGELEHVYTEFDGLLELRLPAGEGGLTLQLEMSAPEGHSEYHVAGDMSASQVRLAWHDLQGVRASD